MSAGVTRVVHVREGIDGAVYIGRGTRGIRGSALANPFKIGEHGDRAGVVKLYETWLIHEVNRGNPRVVEALIAARGKPLACWCRKSTEPRWADTLCHGDVVEALLTHNSDEAIREGRVKMRRQLT